MYNNYNRNMYNINSNIKIKFIHNNLLCINNNNIHLILRTRALAEKQYLPILYI